MLVLDLDLVEGSAVGWGDLSGVTGTGALGALELGPDFWFWFFFSNLRRISRNKSSDKTTKIERSWKVKNGINKYDKTKNNSLSKKG